MRPESFYSTVVINKSECKEHSNSGASHLSTLNTEGSTKICYNKHVKSYKETNKPITTKSMCALTSETPLDQMSPGGKSLDQPDHDSRADPKTNVNNRETVIKKYNFNNHNILSKSIIYKSDRL